MLLLSAKNRFCFGLGGLYGLLGIPPKERVSPPDSYWEDQFFQIGLSIQYVF